MYVQSAVPPSRKPAVSRVVSVEHAPTLQDVFNGQPADTFRVGEATFREGDSADHIFHVSEGVLRVCKLLQDGRRAIMGFIYPGEVMGVSFHNRYLFTAEAVTDAKVRKLPRSRFLTLVDESPKLRPQLFAIMCDEMSAAQDQMLLLGRKGAEERVASFLLAVQRKIGNGSIVELAMSRLDVADYLGLTIETVSRTMTDLARRGLISVNGRTTVILRRQSALQEIAGNCDNTDDVLQESTPLRRAVWPS